MVCVFFTSSLHVSAYTYDDYLNTVFDNWYTSYEWGYYVDAVKYYLEFIKANWASSNINYQSAINNLVLAYKTLWKIYFDKQDWENALKNYYWAYGFNSTDFVVNFNMWAANYNRKDYINALTYYQAALKLTTEPMKIKLTEDAIAATQQRMKELTTIQNAKTNDPLYYKQYYLDKMNIPTAWSSIPKLSKPVIIAVIDDGVNINHPDLTNNMRTNKHEIPGNKIDDDENWYIDDFNGWNFIYRGNNVLPLGEHGSMVAGIIGASINNKLWISGIVPNIKIMPIGVFNSGGTSSYDYVIKGMRYAINNWANIINLSLGGSQFSYSNKLDSIIKLAYDKGIIVVIAAGNGDILSHQTSGVNTTVNKLSPVCNDVRNKKMVIGVWSYDENWSRSPRSNYGDCVDTYGFWENIVSTTSTSTVANPDLSYTIGNGTSFSAPMIAGIIGLWFNKFGKVSPNLVYDSITTSIKHNDVENWVIDANLYLNTLEGQLNIACVASSWTKKNNGWCTCKTGYYWVTTQSACVKK